MHRRQQTSYQRDMWFPWIAHFAERLGLQMPQSQDHTATATKDRRKRTVSRETSHDWTAVRLVSLEYPKIIGKNLR